MAPTLIQTKNYRSTAKCEAFLQLLQPTLKDESVLKGVRNMFTLHQKTVDFFRWICVFWCTDDMIGAGFCLTPSIDEWACIDNPISH